MANMIPRFQAGTANRLQGRQELNRLQGRLTGATDPAQQARIQQRMGYISQQTGAKALPSPAGTTPQTGGVATSPAAQPIDVNRATTRLNWLKKVRPNDPEIAKLQARIGAATPQTPAPVTGGAEPTPTPTPEAPPEETFKATQDFLPADVTSSPMYQWRLKQGQDALDRQLSAQGLTGSGAGIAKELGMANQLTGEETQRAYNIAQGDADRYTNQGEGAANRALQASQNNSGNAFQFLQMMLNQNPMDYAYKGFGDYANQVGAQGKANAGYAGSNYAHVSGGGGGGSGPMYAPPFASGPNYSQIDALRAGQSGQNSSDFLGSIGKILGSLGGLF